MIDELLEDMKKHFRYLVVTRGDNCCFLGMDIQITDKNIIKIDIKEQLEEVIKKFEGKFEGEVSFPAQHPLFLVK